MPPETTRVSPVTQRESSDARNTATGAISLGLSQAAKRRLLHHLRFEVAADYARSMGAFRLDPARVDGVDADLAGAELLGEHPGDRIHRCLRGGID